MAFVLAFRPARVMLPWPVTPVFIHRQIVRFRTAVSAAMNVVV